MSFYLVDFENVTSDGLKGIDKLDENDSVVIFYSEKADKITFEVYNKLSASKAEIKLKKVTVGSKNALDFQLAAYLGYSAAKNGDDTHFIVSNDNGYNVLCKFWNNISVKVICNMEQGINTVNKKKKQAAEEQSSQPAAQSSQPTEQSNTKAKNIDKKTTAEISSESMKTSILETSVYECEVSVKKTLTKLTFSEEAIVKNRLAHIISDDKNIKWIIQYMNNTYKNTKKQERKMKLYNALREKFGSGNDGLGVQIYRIIQSVYSADGSISIENRLNAVDSNDINWIIKCINEIHQNEEKNKWKSSVHTSLCKKYGSDLGTELYRAIKTAI